MTENVTKTQLTATATTSENLPVRMADFETLSAALDYAAQGECGINFYGSKAELETVLSYADLAAEAKKLATHFLSHDDLERGDRICIIADMTPDFIKLFFACQYAGLMAVPLPAVSGLGSRDGYEGQLERIIRTSQAKMAIGTEKSMDSLTKAAETSDLLLVGTLADIENMPSAPADLAPLRADENSHIQFSSGSTRKPLGIMISQDALMANARSVALHGLQFRDNDRVASWLPFYHDMGLIGFLIIPLTCQMSIDYLKTDGFARRPLSWLQIISDNKCTMAYSPSFGYELCSRRAKRQQNIDLDLSSWRVAGIGGEMVQPEILEDFTETFRSSNFSEKAFVPSYGLAEMTLAFSFAPLDTGLETDRINKEKLVEDHLAEATKDAKFSRDFALCGQALPGYKIEIRDHNGTVLPDRTIGTIFIHGPSMMSGYDLNPEETDKVIGADGWLNTGDMGYMKDGDIVITGRHKDLLIINGRNIWPQDLEWQVEQELDLLNSRDTAAFAVTTDKGSDEAVMLAHCRSQDPETQTQLRKDIQAIIFRTAGIHCKIMLLQPGTLPYTTSGKLSRALARKNYCSKQYTDVQQDNTAGDQSGRKAASV